MRFYTGCYVALYRGRTFIADRQQDRAIIFSTNPADIDLGFLPTDDGRYSRPLEYDRVAGVFWQELRGEYGGFDGVILGDPRTGRPVVEGGLAFLQIQGAVEQRRIIQELGFTHINADNWEIQRPLAEFNPIAVRKPVPNLGEEPLRSLERNTRRQRLYAEHFHAYPPGGADPFDPEAEGHFFVWGIHGKAAFTYAGDDPKWFGHAYRNNELGRAIPMGYKNISIMARRAVIRDGKVACRIGPDPELEAKLGYRPEDRGGFYLLKAPSPCVRLEYVHRELDHHQEDWDNYLDVRHRLHSLGHFATEEEAIAAAAKHPKLRLLVAEFLYDAFWH